MTAITVLMITKGFLKVPTNFFMLHLWRSAKLVIFGEALTVHTCLFVSASKQTTLFSLILMD